MSYLHLQLESSLPQGLCLGAKTWHHRACCKVSSHLLCPLDQRWFWRSTLKTGSWCAAPAYNFTFGPCLMSLSSFAHAHACIENALHLLYPGRVAPFQMSAGVKIDYTNTRWPSSELMQTSWLECEDIPKDAFKVESRARVDIWNLGHSSADGAHWQRVSRACSPTHIDMRISVNIGGMHAIDVDCKQGVYARFHHITRTCTAAVKCVDVQDRTQTCRVSMLQQAIPVNMPGFPTWRQDQYSPKIWSDRSIYVASCDVVRQNYNHEHVPMHQPASLRLQRTWSLTCQLWYSLHSVGTTICIKFGSVYEWSETLEDVAKLRIGSQARRQASFRALNPAAATRASHLHFNIPIVTCAPATLRG